MNCGVYLIRAPSGHCYVGSSNDFRKRWSTHKSALRRNAHASRALQNAWNKYDGNLQFEPMIVCLPNDRILYEDLVIKGLKPKYNARPAAGGGGAFGRIVSRATREKLAAQKGWKHTAEARAKMRGRRATPEQRRKMSSAKTGKPGPWRGKIRSPETAAKISATLKSRVTPPFWLYRKNLVQS